MQANLYNDEESSFCSEADLTGIPALSLGSCGIVEKLFNAAGSHSYINAFEI